MYNVPKVHTQKGFWDSWLNGQQLVIIFLPLYTIGFFFKIYFPDVIFFYIAIIPFRVVQGLYIGPMITSAISLLAKYV